MVDNIIDYIQKIMSLESEIEYLKEDIRILEEEKEYYRKEANKV